MPRSTNGKELENLGQLFEEDWQGLRTKEFNDSPDARLAIPDRSPGLESRYILSWTLSQVLELDFVLTAVDNILLQATPEIWNSDQGSYFSDPKYLQRLQNVKISMDGRGRVRDNTLKNPERIVPRNYT